jgi:hypothetical protein
MSFLTRSGISYSFDKKQMYHHGEPVESIDRKLALLKFIEFISAHNSLVLVGHSISTYDSHILRKQPQQNNILAEFLRLIIGCIDTLKCSRKKMLKGLVFCQCFLPVLHDDTFVFYQMSN